MHRFPEEDHEEGDEDEGISQLEDPHLRGMEVPTQDFASNHFYCLMPHFRDEETRFKNHDMTDFAGKT